MEDGEWVLWDGQPFSIDMLPVIDPAPFRTTSSLPSDEGEGEGTAGKGKKKGTSQKPRRATKQVVWVKASGIPATRLKKARFYVRGSSWKSMAGLRGHGTSLDEGGSLGGWMGTGHNMGTTQRQERWG